MGPQDAQKLNIANVVMATDHTAIAGSQQLGASAATQQYLLDPPMGIVLTFFS